MKVVEFRAGAFIWLGNGLLCRESPARGLHGQNDNELWKSEKSGTLSYTVAHSSF